MVENDPPAGDHLPDSDRQEERDPWDPKPDPSYISIPKPGGGSIRIRILGIVPGEDPGDGIADLGIEDVGGKPSKIDRHEDTQEPPAHEEPLP